MYLDLIYIQQNGVINTMEIKSNLLQIYSLLIVLVILSFISCTKETNNPVTSNDIQKNIVDWEGHYPNVNTQYKDSIAFSSTRFIGTHIAPSVYIASIDGSGMRALTIKYTCTFPSWSPRRWKIIYVACTNYVSNNPRYSLFMMDANGTNHKRITPANENVIGKASWSPDGNTIAYIERDTTYEFSRGRIKLINPDGTNPRIITDWINELNTISWAPTSSALVFAGFRTDGKGRIFRVNSDGSNLAPLNIGENCYNPSFSPDGKMLAYSYISDRFSHIFVYDFASQKVTQVSKEERFDYTPSWSSDSKYIIYASSPIGAKTTAIKKIKYDGTESSFVTDDSNFDYNPSWYN